MGTGGGMRNLIVILIFTTMIASAETTITVKSEKLAVTVDTNAPIELSNKPTDHPYGIAVPAETSGIYYSLTPTDEGDIIVVEAHASPYDPVAHKARIEAEYQRRLDVGNELGLTPTQKQKLQTYFNADVGALFPNLTANQRAFMKVQKQAVRFLMKMRVKELSEEQ